MATYDIDDWTQRMLALFPQAWGAQGLKPGGNFYALIRGIASAYVNHTIGQNGTTGQLTYLQNESRVATATDSALDAIAKDFFGPTYVRGMLYDGKTLTPETDAAFSARIRADVVAPKQTLAAIQYKVQEYISNFYVAAQVLNIQLLGLDTVGGLDTRGALDGRPVDVPPIPSVYVFDRRSNPKLAAKIPLTPGQFCILLTYGGLKRDGFFLGYTHIGKNSHLLNPALQITAPPTTALDAIVQKTKAFGFQQVYADNRGA